MPELAGRVSSGRDDDRPTQDDIAKSKLGEQGIPGEPPNRLLQTRMSCKSQSRSTLGIPPEHIRPHDLSRYWSRVLHAPQSGSENNDYREPMTAYRPGRERFCHQRPRRHSAMLPRWQPRTQEPRTWASRAR